ncbi:hypothetical protein LOTGIDRAFT_232747 [Lottia gigantea]|uniref:Uncharacterized protein n=1 Tax=Lottia gigantea TaxID=225164 RepID=V4BWA3_LOTGI|nr:hypothetical protein LOTGIDRAFT_232747 [Lottia gigantea]ESO93329.1 hypothetical protein LOTGIDRAFT_232747 [Lottia gigantea]
MDCEKMDSSNTLSEIGRSVTDLKEKREPMPLGKVSTSSTGNISIKQYLCVRDSLPKSSLTKTILYDNVIEDRYLELNLSKLSLRRNRTSLYQDINKRAFKADQKRKHEDWRNRHEVAMSSISLPIIQQTKCLDFPCFQHSRTIFGLPVASRSHNQQISPLLKVRRQETAVRFKTDEQDASKPEDTRHCKKRDLNGPKVCLKDPRFKGLHSNLQKVILKKWDPMENMMPKSRFAKFAERLKSKKNSRKVVVATRNSALKFSYIWEGSWALEG